MDLNPDQIDPNENNAQSRPPPDNGNPMVNPFSHDHQGPFFPIQETIPELQRQYEEGL